MTTTFEHVTRRDNNREGYLADAMTMYSIDHIFEEAFSLSMFSKIVLGEFNTDLDHIYDRCEEQSIGFEKALRLITDKLYESCNPFQKNKLIYKYFHNLGLEINSLVDKVTSNLREVTALTPVFDSDRNSAAMANEIKRLYHIKLQEYASLETLPEYFDRGDGSEFKLLRCIDDFLYNHLEVFRKVKKDITQTFNNVISNEYRIKQNRNRLFLRNLAGSNITRSFVPGLNSYTRTNSSTYSTYSSNLVTEITSSTMNSTLGWEDLIQPDLYQTNVTLVKSKPEPVTKKTPGVKILNKSLKIIRKFMPAKDLEEFLKCMEVFVPGNRFVFGFKLRNRKDLIEYSNSINNFSISWDLNVYTLDGFKIARSCITFKQSPILDQVLSVWMMLKAGNEDKVILNSGWFDKVEPLFTKKLEPVLKKLREIERDKNEERIQTRLAENPDDWTLDGSRERFGNMRRERWMQGILEQAEIKMYVKSWIKDYLIANGFDPVLYEYATNLDVSWGEAVDYEAFNLFNINCFDNLVKPIQWRISNDRFKNCIKLGLSQKVTGMLEEYKPLSARTQISLDSCLNRI